MKSTTTLIFTKLVAIAIVLPCVSCSYGDDQLVDISESALAIEKRIQSLHVSYISRNTRKKNAPNGAYLYREFRAIHDGHFYHTSGHGFDGFDWKVDPFRQTTFVDRLSNTNLYNLERSFFTHELAPSATLPGSMKEEPFFLSTGLWPFSEREVPRSERNVLMLRELFSDLTKINLDSISEVEGTKVALISTKTGSDKFWFDMSRDCSLIKREFIDVKRSATISVFENLDQTEVADGIWLPMKIAHHEYDFLASQPSDRSRRIFTGVFEVSTASVNAISKLNASFVPPKGSVLLSASDRTKLPVQVTSGATDYFDSISRWIKMHFATNPETRYSPFAVVVGIFSGVFLGLLVGRSRSSNVHAACD